MQIPESESATPDRSATRRLATAVLLGDGPASFAGTLLLLIVACAVPWWLIGDTHHLYLMNLVLPSGILLVFASALLAFYALNERPAPAWTVVAMAVLQSLLAVWCRTSTSI